MLRCLLSRFSWISHSREERDREAAEKVHSSAHTPALRIHISVSRRRIFDPSPHDTTPRQIGLDDTDDAVPPFHLPPPSVKLPWHSASPSTSIATPTAPTTPSATLQSAQQTPHHNARATEDYRAKLLRYKEPDIEEEEEEIFPEDDESELDGMARGVANRGGMVGALENWDDDFLDQSSPSSSPKVSRMAGAGSTSPGPSTGIRPRNSMDSAAWDMSSDDEAAAGKDPFPGALTPTIDRPPPMPSIHQAHARATATPRAKSPTTPTFPPSAANINFPTNMNAYAGPSRSVAGVALRRRSTRDSRASSRWDDSDGEAFYTPRDTMVFDQPSQQSSESHYEPTEETHGESVSRYGPTPDPRNSHGLVPEDDYAGEADGEEEGEGDRTVTLNRAPVQIESEDEDDWERELQARYHGEGEHDQLQDEYDGMPETATPMSATFPPHATDVRVSAFPTSTSPPPPPSPTNGSRSRSQLGHIAGRPSIGGGSSIFSSSVKSTQALMGKSTAPPSRYPNRPAGKESERPRRRLRKKSRPPEEMGMTELRGDPSSPASHAPPGEEEHGEEMSERAETPYEHEAEVELEDPPPLPTRARLEPVRLTPYTVPAAPTGPPTHAPTSHSRNIFSPSSSSASPGAFLTRLSSITKLFPRSASSSFRSPEPPTAAARQPNRAASASPTPPNPSNGYQQSSVGPVIPGLPVASAAAANTVFGHRRGKGSAPPIFSGDRDKVDEIFGTRRNEEPSSSPTGVEDDTKTPVDKRPQSPVLLSHDPEGEQHVDPQHTRDEMELKPPTRKLSWRKSSKSSGRNTERDTGSQKTERPRSQTISGALPVPVPPIPPPPPESIQVPVQQPPIPAAPPPEEKKKRKPRKLSHRRPRGKEDAIKHARDSLEGHAVADIKSGHEDVPALPTVLSGKTLDLHGQNEPISQPEMYEHPMSSSAGEEVSVNWSTSSPVWPASPYYPRASSPLSSAPESSNMSPTSPFSPSVGTMDKKDSQTSELKIPHRISVQQRSLKEGLTDVRLFAGIVEGMTPQSSVGNFAICNRNTQLCSPFSQPPHLLVRLSSAASQHQIEAGLARLESGPNTVWWELASVLVDLGGSSNTGSVRAARDRIGSRIAHRRREDEDRGTMSATEAEPSQRSGRPTPRPKSRLRSASAAPTKSSLSVSPTSPALPSSLEASTPVPRSTSLGAERIGQRSAEESPKELSSRQLILLGEMLREVDTTKVVDYAERSETNAARSRAASRAGLSQAGPPTSPPSRPPTQQSFNASVGGPPERIGRPRRGSKIVANIRDIFAGNRKSKGDSVDVGSTNPDADGMQGASPRRPLKSSSRPPTIQPKGGSRMGSLDNRKSPRKPSLGSLFGSRQSHEKGDRSLPPTISPSQGRRAGNGSSTSIDTDIEYDSEWDRVEHGNDGIPTLRGHPAGTNTNGASASKVSLPIYEAYCTAGKQPLAIQTAFERERTPSMRSVERPPLASAKLALTPENIRPLLSHAKAVKKQLQVFILELRALQPPRGVMKL
ncbi:hypothetical protein DACRYDRAFT_18320 [Dacryopinax primogenitus]|uniref:Uncharacterized protein n=1 Tax=Dacryopinax primogenitus (strain DJM 731) TaxID=1858805 RepID=M5FXQ1_DACPD|nr:uncharacterized protein DACRYDRAFT_18320 [Dacryopinax primogenitus]EJT98291.1 hypothetical protein DACRYDRAFT_18320 [Dacryopinax primogenitus]